MMDAADFAAAFAGAEGGELPPDALERMNALIDELLALEKFIAQTEESLSLARMQATEIKQRTLADLMAELRVDDITRDGFRIKVSDFVSGSLPNEEKKPEEHARAVNYLKTLEGGEELLKTQVAMEFGKGQANIATSIVQDLREKYEIDPKVKFGVHPQTLQAYARERMKSAEPFDPDKLGLYCGTAVKVTEIKPRKGK